MWILIEVVCNIIKEAKLINQSIESFFHATLVSQNAVFEVRVSR